MNPVLEAFLIIIYLLIFAGIGYFFGRRWFDNPEREKLFVNMQKLINCEKRIQSGKQPKPEDMDIDMEFLKKHRKKKAHMDDVFGKNGTKMLEQVKHQDQERKAV